MNCTITNPQIYIGDDTKLKLEFTNNDGTPIDITNWVLYFAIKNSISDSDEDSIYKAKVETHNDPTGGKSEIFISKASAVNFPRGVFISGIRTKDNDGLVTTIMVKTIAITETLPKNLDDES
jgi:hypothetical protein